MSVERQPFADLDDSPVNVHSSVIACLMRAVYPDADVVSRIHVQSPVIMRRVTGWELYEGSGRTNQLERA